MNQDEFKLIKKTAGWKFPPPAQARLNALLEKKPRLSMQEKKELDALIAVNDQLSLLKASAMRILKQKRGRVA